MDIAFAPAGNTALDTSTNSLKTAEPLLEQLVTYFVASKKSLASTSHVWHANGMVAKARNYVEDIASLYARNSCLRQSITNNIYTLKAVRLILEEIGREVQADFKTILQHLDAADIRIKRVVQILQTTQVEASILPQVDQQKHLYDFVDENGVDNLATAFRECIDETSQAQGDFTLSINAFDDEVRAIEDLVKSSVVSESNQIFKNTASVFRSLEFRAAEMAQELESLIRHYDFCMTALRHTDGGGEAVQNTKVDLPPGIPVESFHQDVLPAPISADERAEMMTVLQNDAAEVEGAIQEIRDHSTEMELELEQVSKTVALLKTEHELLNRSMNLLTVTANSLPNYIQASADLQLNWNAQRRIIEEKLEELEVLREFYDGFLHAFDGLLSEVQRRQTVKGKMEKIVRDALSKLDRLYQDDLEERKSFRLEQGDYLPSDIWPGLGDAPPRYELKLVNEKIINPSELDDKDLNVIEE